MDDDDVFGRGSGDARDDISSLPKKVAVKVGSLLLGIVIFKVKLTTCTSLSRRDVVLELEYARDDTAHCPQTVVKVSSFFKFA